MPIKTSASCEMQQAVKVGWGVGWGDSSEKKSQKGGKKATEEKEETQQGDKERKSLPSSLGLRSLFLVTHLWSQELHYSPKLKISFASCR